MKILKILDSHDTGGIYTCERQFIKDMVLRGHQIDGIIIGSGKNVEVYKELLGNFVHIEEEFNHRRFRSIKSILYMNRYCNQLAGKIDKLIDGEYDSIIYRRTAFLFFAGHLKKMIKTETYWFMPKSMQSRFQKYFYLFFLKKFGIKPIANSNYTKKSLGGYCKHYVYPGYDEHKVQMTNSTFRSALGIAQDSPVYGIAARLDYEKAHDIVIKAFIDSDIPQKGGHLLIAGKPLTGIYFETLKKICGTYFAKKIHFLGYVENMAKFYSSVDVMINGRRDAEPFGITVAESLAFGKPVIAYDLGGPTEMIKNGENGWLVKDPNVDHYKKALQISYNQRHNWPNMSINAINKADQFSSRNSVSKFLDILSHG